MSDLITVMLAYVGLSVVAVGWLTSRVMNVRKDFVRVQFNLMALNQTVRALDEAIDRVEEEMEKING